MSDITAPFDREKLIEGIREQVREHGRNTCNAEAIRRGTLDCLSPGTPVLTPSRQCPSPHGWGVAGGRQPNERNPPMAQVIGGLLTSKANAGSLQTGDSFMFDEMCHTVREAYRFRSQPTAVSLYTSTPERGYGYLNFHINHPLNRVVGGRTAGTI